MTHLCPNNCQKKRKTNEVCLNFTFFGSDRANGTDFGSHTPVSLLRSVVIVNSLVALFLPLVSGSVSQSDNFTGHGHGGGVWSA